jgi:uncharacterized membrane protein YuzA (DUF378 family)
MTGISQSNLKELHMATMDTPITERRHIPDRRTAMTKMHQRSRMSALDWIAMALMIIGSINWGLVGLFNVNLVASLFGEQSLISRIIYVAVGIAALYSLYLSSKMASDKT